MSLHIELWLRINCFNLCKSSYFTYRKYTKSGPKEGDVIRQFIARIVNIIVLLFQIFSYIFLALTIVKVKTIDLALAITLVRTR